MIAIAFGTINVIGGFLVTDRMLGMFKGRKAKQVEAGRQGRGGRGMSDRAHASFLQDRDFINVLYILAVILFITGLRMLRGPRTAVQGNQIAAVGMAIAVVATLLIRGVGDWGLMVLGVAIGTAVGIPSARSVKMTAMPQMVALFNGVGGGAVALISITEYREALHLFDENPELATLIPSLFAAIIGSVSFWGSLVAFAKLQELICGRPVRLPGGSLVNIVLLADRGRARGRRSRAGTESEALFWLILRRGRRARHLRRAADRRRRHAGRDLDPERVHRPVRRGGRHRAGQHRADRRRHARRRVRLDPHQADGRRDEPLDRQRVLLRLRRRRRAAAGRVGDDGVDRTAKSTSAADVAIQLSYARLVVVVPGYGMAVAQAQRAVADLATALEKRGVEVLFAIHPVAGRMPGHMNVLLAEADVPVRQAQGDGRHQPGVRAHRRRPDHRRQRRHQPGGAQRHRTRRSTACRSSTSTSPQSVIVLKRSMCSGFAGIDNPLFYDDKTRCSSGTPRRPSARSSPRSRRSSAVGTGPRRVGPGLRPTQPGRGGGADGRRRPDSATPATKSARGAADGSGAG